MRIQAIMPTIGQTLGEERIARGLSIEDAAHETRIPPGLIFSIEEDDFSQFPSVAYARSFIRKYSEYLEVDLSSAMEALNSGTTGKIGDNELMGEMKKTISKDRRFRSEYRPKSYRRRLEKPGGAPLFLNFILGSLLVGLGVFYFLGYNAPSPEEAKSEITRGLQKANPFSGKVADESTSTVSEVAPTNRTESGMVTPAANPETAVTLPTTDPVAEKPRVWVQFEDTLAEAADPAALPANQLEETPLPPSAPKLIFSEDPVRPFRSADLPAPQKPAVEPQAVLRPEGTDPTAERPAANPPESNPPPSRTPPPRPIRAVPVAATE